MDEATYDKGREIRTQVLGEAYVAKAAENDHTSVTTGGRKSSGAISVLALATILALATMLGTAPAHGTPAPGFCPPPASLADDVCTARLTSVTADDVDATITGTPVGGKAPITLAGQADAYLKSAGFGEQPPDHVQQWDATIDRANNADLSGPDWYGNAKSRVFMPRTLDELATHFPPKTLVVRFVPDDTHSGWFQLESIQPIAQ